MKFINYVSTLILAAAALQSCASSETNRRIDEKMSQGSAITSRAELLTTAQKRIENDPTLTDDQKKRLSILRSKIGTQMEDLSNQSLQLRAMLVDEILSPKYRLDEVNAIKKRLRKVEDQRLSLTFEGVDQANSILGREAPKHMRVMRDLLDFRARE